MSNQNQSHQLGIGSKAMVTTLVVAIYGLYERHFRQRRCPAGW